MAEERGHERAQAVQTSLSAEAGDDNVLSTTFHVPIDERDEEHEITTALEPARDIQHKGTIKSTFTLRTHDGDGYVLPFLPWEVSRYVEILLFTRLTYFRRRKFISSRYMSSKVARDWQKRSRTTTSVC
jgi:hypothetical protein